MVDLIWPTFVKDRRLFPAPATSPPDEPLPEGLLLFSLQPDPARTQSFWIDGRGKPRQPSAHRRRKRLLTGVHWLYVNRQRPSDATLRWLAEPAQLPRFATRVTLGDVEAEPTIALESPHLSAAIAATANQAAWAAAPTSEGLDGQLRWVYMSTYQRGYTPDLVARGLDLGFRVVIQHDPAGGQTAASVRRDLARDLRARGVADADAIADGRSPMAVQLVETQIGLDHFDPWGEDNKWVTRGTGGGASAGVDGVQVVYPPDADAQIPVARTLTAERGYHPIEAGFQGNITGDDLHQAARDLAAALGRGGRQTKVYIEGGNMLSGTQASRWPYALVGYDSLVVSMLRMDAQRTAAPLPNGLSTNGLSDHDVELAWAHLRRAAPNDQAQVEDDLRRAREDLERRAPLEAAARARLAREQATVPRDDDLIARLEEFLAHVDELQRLEPVLVRAGDGAATRARKAWEYLARLEATRIEMMIDVSCSPSNFAILDQLEFHNDMFMRPLGPSAVLLNDFDVCDAMLTQVLAWAPAAEQQALRDMQPWVRQKATEYRALTQLVHDQCRRLGLAVVRCPGVFRTESPVPSPPPPPWTGADPFHRWANFLNAVPGTVASGTAARLAAGTTFYMTNDTNLTALRTAFRDWLRDPARGLGVQEVFFLGGEEANAAVPGSRPAISESEWSLYLSGGLDCRESHHPSRWAELERDLAEDPSARSAPPTAMA